MIRSSLLALLVLAGSPITARAKCAMGHLAPAVVTDAKIVAGGGILGATDDVPFLHFNVCYYHSIEQCILRKIARFEPGAGGEHKRVRGFAPTLTYSVHHLVDPRLRGAVSEYLGRERDYMDRVVRGEIEEE